MGKISNDFSRKILNFVKLKMRRNFQSKIKDDLSHQAIIEIFAKKDLLDLDNSTTKISKELVCNNIKLKSPLSSLKKKMIGIWIDSINILNEIEIKFEKSLSKKLSLINEKYKNIRCTKNEELAELTLIADIEKSKDALAREYLYVLKFMYRIRQYYFSAIDRQLITFNPFSPDFIDDVFKDKNFECINYLSFMAYGFLDLTIHCERLREICKIPKGVPISDEIKINRATNAAMARHEKNMLFGEYYLQERIFNLVKELNLRRKYEKEDSIKRFRNIHSFVKYEKKLFESEINEYKKMLGKPFFEGGPEINFGEDLDLPELVKLMRKWRKKEEFDILIKNFLYMPKNSQ
ncbi:MAG: hypothetical protein RSC68_09580 [Acinetobacter sp.]